MQLQFQWSNQWSFCRDTDKLEVTLPPHAAVYWLEEEKYGAITWYTCRKKVKFTSLESFTYQDQSGLYNGIILFKSDKKNEVNAFVNKKIEEVGELSNNITDDEATCSDKPVLATDTEQSSQGDTMATEKEDQPLQQMLVDEIAEEAKASSNREAEEKLKVVMEEVCPPMDEQFNQQLQKINSEPYVQPVMAIAAELSSQGDTNREAEEKLKIVMEEVCPMNDQSNQQLQQINSGPKSYSVENENHLEQTENDGENLDSTAQVVFETPMSMVIDERSTLDPDLTFVDTSNIESIIATNEDYTHEAITGKKITLQHCCCNF